MSLDTLTGIHGTASGVGDLASLRRAARAGEADATREVAKQFEALFLQMMIKQMREAMPAEGGLFGNSGTELYESMHDQQLSLAMAQRQGIGLAAAIERQLSPPPRVEGDRALQFPATRVPARPEPATRPETAYTRPLAGAGAVHAGAEAPPGRASSADPADFVRRMLPHAERAAARLGVAPEVLVAQSALETGWGRHVMNDAAGRPSHNMFGIKASGGWQGERVTVSTLEYRDGVARQERAAFRSYPDPAASFSDYARLVGDHPRYRNAVAGAADPESYLRGLQQAGYATDPAYADKVLNILERGLPGLSPPAALKPAAARPTTTLMGDPAIARARLHMAGEENT